MDIAVFQYLGGSIDNMTSAFVVSGVQNLMNAIKPLVITCVSIYIMGQAYLQIAGKSDDLAIDVVKSCLLITCITALTLNVGNYTTYIVGGVHALGDGLGNGILPNSNSDNIYQTLDELLKTGINQMLYCWDKGGWRASTWIWYTCGIVIILSIGALTIIAATIIIGTKFILSMLLVVGPIFIIMACFPLTRRFIDNWMGKIFENVLVQLFGIAVVYMVIALVERFIGINDITDNSNINPAAISIQVTVVSAILAYVIRQIPNLAGSLAGGFASALMTLPKAPKLQPKDPNHESINSRQTWSQQQQNQISGGGAKTGTTPKNDLSQDLRERIAEHNLKNK